MCLVDIVNSGLCDLVEYVHKCLCALVNLVNCVFDDVFIILVHLVIFGEHVRMCS